MGDIYHKIKSTVDKLSYQHIARHKRKNPPKVIWKPKVDKQSLRKMKLNDSEDSFESLEQDEKLVEFSEVLREKFK